MGIVIFLLISLVFKLIAKPLILYFVDQLITGYTITDWFSVFLLAFFLDVASFVIPADRSKKK